MWLKRGAPIYSIQTLAGARLVRNFSLTHPKWLLGRVFCVVEAAPSWATRNSSPARWLSPRLDQSACISRRGCNQEGPDGADCSNILSYGSFSYYL